MTEKKKTEAKKPAATQRFSDVAKELGIEVKTLLALVDQFVVARPDYKDYVYSEGKKPAASSNFGKTYREDFLNFAADKLPKKADPVPEPVVEAPKAPEPAKPVTPVAKLGTPPPVSMPPRPTIVPTPQAARPPVTPIVPRPSIAPTPAKADLPPVVVSTPPPIPSRPANAPPVVRPPIAPVVNRPAATGNQAAPGSKGAITVRPPIVVRDFAIALNLKPFQVIGNLMELNKVVSVSSVIEEADARKVAERHGYTLEIRHRGEGVQPVKKVEKPSEDDPALMTSRPPVVCVLGHVDHGKTTLLDFFRKTNVVSGEAGGITQHIGAYQVAVVHDGNERLITFIDTPGHEAFTAMRARGAKATDIAILVVAADDGVMPQTVEAINHAQAADVPIVVAVNKIDKEGADPQRIRSQLTEYGLVAEDFGGDTMFVDISAKAGTNIQALEEAVLLTADAALDLRANPNMEAQGVAIEAHLDRGRGPVATVLIQRGTLRVGDSIVAGDAYGRVRRMVDEHGEDIEEAMPSRPVQVIGFTSVPGAGDNLLVVDEDRTARQIADRRSARKRNALAARSRKRISLEDLESALKETSQLNLILKGDNSGTVEALEEALLGIAIDDEVELRVIDRGVGGITETNVNLASASDAIIIGFNVRAEGKATELANREGVEIRYYSVIYQAIDEIEKALKGMLKPIYEERDLGRAEIRAIFRSSKVGNIAGCLVQSGIMRRNAKARLLRDNVVVAENLTISSLKREKDDATEVREGFECGLTVTYADIKEGDIIETYELVEKVRV
jgi:translation initiation factor IF-2